MLIHLMSAAGLTKDALMRKHTVAGERPWQHHDASNKREEEEERVCVCQTQSQTLLLRRYAVERDGLAITPQQLK